MHVHVANLHTMHMPMYLFVCTCGSACVAPSIVFVGRNACVYVCHHQNVYLMTLLLV